MSFKQVLACITSTPHDIEAILASIRVFVQKNEDPNISTNLRTSGRDNYKPLLNLLDVYEGK